MDWLSIFQRFLRIFQDSLGFPKIFSFGIIRDSLELFTIVYGYFGTSWWWNDLSRLQPIRTSNFLNEINRSVREWEKKRARRATWINATLTPSDTEELYTQATQAVADPYGKTFTWDIKVKQMGLVSMDLASLVVTEMQLPITPAEYLRQVEAIHQRLFPTAALLPGIPPPTESSRIRRESLKM